MTTKLLLPVLLLAACGDNLHPDDVQDLSPVSDEGSGGHDAPAREIDAAIYINPITCDATIAEFEADARYVDDGSPVTNVACLWTFDDGTTSTSCAGEHAFAAAGDHDFVLELTDLATGAKDTVEQRRFFQPPLEANLEVSGDDLSLTYNATVNVGAQVHVFVTPEEKVIAADPNYPLQRNYTLRVKEAGTYTVEMTVEDERGTGEICEARIVKQIDLVCDGIGHVH